MKLFRGVTNIPPNFTGCVASIGNFDGVHLGHQVIIQKLIEISSVLEQPSVLITFEPQPNEFFSDPETTPPRLMRFREKWLTLQTFSLNYLLCLPFNKSLADLSAESFIEEILVHHLKVKHVLVGDDFQFGKHRSGNINTLQERGKKFNFTVSHLPTYKIGDERVSSSNIRSTLQNGDLEKARILLGKDYGIFGKVVHGSKRGRMIGFPTANIFLHRKIAPLHGVYAVKIKIAATNCGGFLFPWYGVANIGTRPTVDGTRSLLEIHIFDFDADIYGKSICVEFKKKLRDEKRYHSFELLRQQILNDAKEARAYFVLMP